MTPTIHFKNNHGRYTAACRPYTEVPVTEAPRLVTCGNCKRTKVFKKEQ